MRTSNGHFPMRPGQNNNNKRARRGRKPHNMMGRTFDSSGPDVKIRGTAAHIFEKYQTLARDANASGDRITAESYLQHAEHYFRLLNSFQNAGGFNGRPNGAPMADGQGPQPGPRLNSSDDDGDDDGEGSDDGDESEQALA